MYGLVGAGSADTPLCKAAHTTGPDALQKLPGRWVWMNATETRLFGPWEQWEGMQVSNTFFVPRLRAAKSRRSHTQAADKRSVHQSCLFAC